MWQWRRPILSSLKPGGPVAFMRTYEIVEWFTGPTRSHLHSLLLFWKQNVSTIHCVPKHGFGVDSRLFFKSGTYSLRVQIVYA